MYIYSFLFFVTAYDDSRFKRYKILFQLRNSQLTKSRNVHLTTFNVTNN